LENRRGSAALILFLCGIGAGASRAIARHYCYYDIVIAASPRLL
jgi:hypothetical protein